MEGSKEVLGFYLSENEGAKFWLGVLTDLKNRGVQEIFIACMDGLTVFPDAVRWEAHWDDLNASLRKVTKNRAAFPDDEAIFKIMYLAIRKASKKWTMPIRNCGLELNQFAILFGTDRVKI